MRPIVAYVLAVVQTGKEYDVVEELKKLDGIVDVTITYGQWDLVIKVEVGSLEELDKLVTEIRQTKGIERTTTLLGI